mgnify:CR=1 FL=1
MKQVSIHAPAWGATCSGLAFATLYWRFQFTRPRGARHPAADNYLTPESFNSRARVGRDAADLQAFIAVTPFQFTRPRGARRG